MTWLRRQTLGQTGHEQRTVSYWTANVVATYARSNQLGMTE